MEIIDYSTLYEISFLGLVVATVLLVIFSFLAIADPYAIPLLIFVWFLVVYAHLNTLVFRTVYIEVSEEGLVVIKGMAREKGVWIPRNQIEKVYTTYVYLPIFLLGGAIGGTQMLVEVKTNDGWVSFVIWGRDYYPFCHAVQKYLGVECIHDVKIFKFKTIA